MTSKQIRLATDFSATPGGRFRADGPYSGQEFRDDFLIPVLREYDDVTVVLDGVEGLPSSFLEEAFGGLVRAGFAPRELSRSLKVVSNDPLFETYCLLAYKYIREARREVVAA